MPSPAVARLGNEVGPREDQSVHGKALRHERGHRGTGAVRHHRHLVAEPSGHGQAVPAR